MFVREHQNQFRGAQADVQTFYGNSLATSSFSWNKPVGVSFVYIMLIGAGGLGDGTTGGGSGAVSVWFGPAKSIPSSLRVIIGATLTYIEFTGRTFATTIMSSAGTNTPVGAAASTSNGYWAQGFSNFTAGDNGSTGGAVASSTSFLSQGGAGTATANYGYTSNNTSAGYFLFSPIIVGVSEGSNRATRSAYGCGSNTANTTVKSPGLALIASW